MRATTEPLAKQLRLLDVYAVATGATLSAGFFLLPGLAAREAGPGLVLAYMLAVVPLVPAMFSIAELGTAMPRAGGVYYFLDRSLGPLVGTVGGIGTWLALVLKVAFALVGMGAYVEVFLPELPIIPVGLGVAVGIGALNLWGTRSSGRFQIALLVALLAILVVFLGTGLPAIRLERFRGWLSPGVEGLSATAGMVYISYVGLTKIASLSEEVEDPERNLPRGIFLALGTAVLVYGLGTAVMVGVVPMERLAGDLTPVATAAGAVLGRVGVVVVSVAALAAFVSVANAGTLSASRYPLALGRDRLAPDFLARVGDRGTPWVGIVVTVAAIAVVLVALDPTKIAKLASAFQLLMFALVCLAVIVMRESRIDSYDPGFHSPLYPWMQILGIVAPAWLIFEMGWLPTSFSLGLVAVGALWYRVYARRRVEREGAVYHVFERLGRRRDAGLDPELRQIMKEKGGARGSDPFEEVVARAAVIDVGEPVAFEVLARDAAERIADGLETPPGEIAARFVEESRMGSTPVSHGVALPHQRLAELGSSRLVLARTRGGVGISEEADAVPWPGPIHAVFFLASPEADPGRHLRLLAQIARRVEDEAFLERWDAARSEAALKEALLRGERAVSLRLDEGSPARRLVGRTVAELDLPEGARVATLRRGTEVVPADDATVLEAGDRLTVVGDARGIRVVETRFGGH